MRKILVVIDMQKDFVDGALGSKEAVAIVPAVVEKIADKKEIELELIGLCTDICVVSNALMLKAFMPEVKISVDSSCCAGVTPEKHEATLLLSSNPGTSIIPTINLTEFHSAPSFLFPNA